MLADEGTQFRPARSETSEFETRCCELGIEHITANESRPIAAGKIEALHKVYEAEFHVFNQAGVSSDTVITLDLTNR